MKKIWIIIIFIVFVFIWWCSVSVDFDGAIIDRFINKISYLYANCWSDIEWLQEVMTPETIQSMDQTCVASIKAITKIKEKLEKMKWKIWNSAVVSNLLLKVNEILNSLEMSKNQIVDLYNTNKLSESFDNVFWIMKTEEEVNDWLEN